MFRSVAGAFLGSMALLGCHAPSDLAGSSASAEDGGWRAPALAPRRAKVVRADGFSPGVIPFRGGGPQRAAASTCKSPRLFYYGGPIVQSPVILAVFWNSSVNATLQKNIGQFYADVTLSSYWPWLQEYDSVGLPGSQAILPGSFGGDFVLSPQRCPATTTGTCALTDDDIQVELIRQIGLGVLPPPTLDCSGNVETLYMVDFPSNVSLTGPSGSGKSCVNNGFCGYHNTGVYGPNAIPLVYGALMDVFTGGCSTGCGGNPTALENATSVHSHELVESVTDPDIGLDTESNYAFPAGWGDNNNLCGEIADICDDGSAGDTITVSGRSWVVQEVWSNKQGKCTSKGAAPEPVCSGTTLTNCRPCSCGDDGVACSGATPACDTTTGTASYGACEACPSGGCPADAGTDAVSDAAIDAPAIEAGTDAGGDAAAIDSGVEAEADGGIDGFDAGNEETGAGRPRDGAADSESIDTGADLDASSGLDSGVSMDATGATDGGAARSDAEVIATGEGGAFTDGSPEMGPNVGDGQGCGCRVAGTSSSRAPLSGFGALAFLLGLRSRRRRGGRP